MNIETMIIIFMIIILPITLIMNVYIQKQIDTLNNQILYDNKLRIATQDSMKAFQRNTLNNTESDISNSKIRDIQASVYAFFNSLENTFNLSGYNREMIRQYVPAVVFTMYDGYYIYSPYRKACNENGVVENSEGNFNNNGLPTEYGLKPYVYYSCRYVKDSDNDFIITYSLDNYIKIQGYINGNVINDAGYIIDYMNVEEKNGGLYYRENLIENEELREYVGNKEYRYAKISGKKYYYDADLNKVFNIVNGKIIYSAGDIEDKNTTAGKNYDLIMSNNARKYYEDAAAFTTRVLNTYHLNNKLKPGTGYKIIYQDGTEENIKDDVFNGIEKKDTNTIVEPNSNFNNHRYNVIKSAINTNLSTSIAGFNTYSGSSTNFQMPKLKETEWDLILNNICVISFLQGLNLGGKTYNGYCVIKNTTNKEVVTEESIYITDSDNKYYKVMDETLLSKSGYIGYFNIDFEDYVIDIDNTDYSYYPRREADSYTSIVGTTGINNNWNGNVYEYLRDPNGDRTQSNQEKALAKAYYTALGRERYGMKK